MSEFDSGLAMGSLLGSGFFGDVYEAIDSLGEKVAVKLLRQAPGESPPDFKARELGLLREASRLLDARHENVVRIKDVVRHRPTGRVLLVAEHCPGGSLEGIYRSGPTPLRAVRDLSTQIALGLQAIHSRGMLHRDIKPANVLLGASGEAKLSDFGLVTNNLILGYASDQGYLDHLAPEVYTTLATSVKTDVWAFGMTVYRLLHGHTWYLEATQLGPPGTLIPKGGFAGSLKWIPHVPNAWRRLVRKCMHDDSQRRFQSAESLLEGLAGLPVEPEWSCTVTPADVKWERPHKGRTIQVTWTRLSPRRHTWLAESRGPTGSRVLRRSKGPIPRSQVERDLKGYFGGLSK